jgi:membrane-bound serine protease (ClpP class)
MDFLLNPNIAYVLLVIGFVFTLLAIITPGTGVLEVVAALLLAIAGYCVYKIGFNLWALVILVLAVFPFVYATRKPKRDWALVLSLVAVIVGSVYMFPGKGFAPAVNPILAIVLSILIFGFFWYVIGKTIRAHHTRPIHDLQVLIGQIGEAKTRIHEDGSIQVAGELWSARSKLSIPAGHYVRVTGREGFILDVEPAPAPDSNS